MSRVRVSIHLIFFPLNSFRHGERPGDQQIERFIQLCNEFSNTNPNDIIGMIILSSNFLIKYIFIYLFIYQVFIVHMVLIEQDFLFVHIFVVNRI